ncbi:MAG: hypothetical protein ACXWTS_06595 [Methylococcaceae bacterium]
MIEIELIIAAIAAVILLIIFFKVRKKISKKETSKKDYKTPEPVINAVENKPAGKPISDTKQIKETLPEPQTKEPISSPEPICEPIIVASQQTSKTVIPAPKDNDENLPQDSMLRRHYLSNLRAMIESLKSHHPTDSSLSRHYDAMIIAEIEHCLSDKEALERLICNYEAHKKTLAQQAQEPKTTAVTFPKTEIAREDSVTQHEIPKLPEDSILRRHAISNLYAIVESRMPLRPTDSVLLRHYDTMINTEVNKLLGM